MKNETIETAWLLLLAIAQFEGYWQDGSRARRNNNPGNLRGYDPGVPKDAGGFDIYPSISAGVSALWGQIWKNVYRGLTLREFFDGKPGIYPGYAPRSDGNPATYPATVSKWTGIPLDSETIWQFIT